MNNDIVKEFAANFRSPRQKQTILIRSFMQQNDNETQWLIQVQRSFHPAHSTIFEVSKSHA